MDKITGDLSGIAALKELVTANPDYMRFLINEATTNVDHAAPFNAKDGTKYLLKVDLATGALEVVAAKR
jgi:hypothetical protein